MDKIGFTTVTFRSLSRREICMLGQDNKISLIEWGGDVHLPPGDGAALDEVLALQEEFGLTAVSYGSYYRLSMNDYSLWENILDTTEAIGAKIVRIWQGSLPSSETDETLLALMVDETVKLGDLAAKRGITIAFEFHCGTNNDEGAAALDFLKRVNMTNVKTYWQPFTTEADGENLAAVLPYLTTVHVFSWDKDGTRYPLAWGEERWKGFISTIRKSGADPYFIMEFVKDDSPEQFYEDVKALKSWLGK